MNNSKIITLDHGSGGLASQNLIGDLFLKYLKSPALHGLEDCAILENHPGRIAMSTDSYVVDPLFFPGGNIGELAVNGTINDLAMRGARPLALSLGLIIEEGFPLEHLERIIKSIAQSSETAEVEIVTGDTKVVPKGKGDGIFINTTGIGIVPDNCDISGTRAMDGDIVLVSGTLADHGITIMSSQAGIAIEGDIQSDTQPLHKLVSSVLSETEQSIHVMRDPTRGGLATTLCEIATSSKVEINLEQDKLPILPSVNAACELIGLDPLYLANEGKCLFICKPDAAQQVLSTMQQTSEGRNAAIIGSVNKTGKNRVTLTTSIGGTRLLEPLTGHPLPRIC